MASKKPILPRKKLNGLAQFIQMMRSVDPQFRAKLFADLQAKAPHLVTLAELSLFMFEDIVRLDDRSMQAALSKVETPKVGPCLETGE